MKKDYSKLFLYLFCLTLKRYLCNLFLLGSHKKLGSNYPSYLSRCKSYALVLLFLLHKKYIIYLGLYQRNNSQIGKI